jgi:type IV pilus assembly protein PilV
LKPSITSRGFSLIELLIALVILSISLLALAGLMTMTTQYNSSGAHVTEAVTLGQDKLEELKAVPWATVNTDTDPAPVTSSTGVNYTRNWAVVTAGSLKTVTITVNWNDKVNHSIRLLSVISQ